MDCKVRVKARQNSGKGADCKEKVKQKKSTGKEENCKIYVKRQRSFDKEDFYENKVKRQQNSGKAKFCKDGVKPARKAGKAAAGGIRREATASTRGEEAGDNLRTPDGQPASACEQAVPEGKTTTADGNRRQKNGRERRPSGQPSGGGRK